MEREGAASHLRVTTSHCNTDFYSVKGTAVLRCPIRHRNQVPPGLLTVADVMPHLPILKKTIALQELVKESANFVLRGSNVKCEFSFPADLWNVEADEGQISQVLNNIIINATHAMSGGGTVQMYCGNVVVDQSDPLVARWRPERRSIRCSWILRFQAVWAAWKR